MKTTYSNYDDSIGVKPGECGGKYAMIQPKFFRIRNYDIYIVTHQRCVLAQQEDRYDEFDNYRAQGFRVHLAMDSFWEAEAQFEKCRTVINARSRHTTSSTIKS